MFFAPGGRLGNLLFQVAFLESIKKPGERVFSTQLKNIKHVVQGLRRYYNSNSKLLINIIDHLVEPLFHVLARFRLIGFCKETDGLIVREKGLIPITWLVGYFQMDTAVRLRLKSGLVQRAQDYLSEIPKTKNLVFLHVRRGDYADFKVNGCSTMLPESYYRLGIEWIRKTVKHPFFVVVGDDPEWCRKQLGDLENKVISVNSPQTDLAIMSLCEGGIVSNSTFAWWGAQLCRQNAGVVGPEFWLGWKASQWIPQSIRVPNWKYLKAGDWRDQNG